MATRYPLGSHFWRAAVPALLGHASLVRPLLGLTRLGSRGLVHHLVSKGFSHLTVPRQLTSLLLDRHSGCRCPWRRLDALGLTRVLLASTKWYK